MSYKFLFAMMILAFLFGSSESLYGQSTATATQIEEMNKIGFLQGEWRGEGWIMLGPNRRETFKQTEVVQSKLDGVTLLIEGLGKSKDGSERVIHNALAIVSYDSQKKSFRFSAYKADGLAIDAEATISQNALVWGFKDQRGVTRFTIRLTEKGEWNEVGEFNPDGKNWYKFFEMTLQHVK
jgi:hypothetical protein